MLNEFTQEVERTAKAIMNETHTALPGKIVSFSSSRGTVTVKPIGKFVTSDGKSLDYPKIADVPLVFPCSATAGTGIAFPIKEGDSCLLIISEVELDEWRTGADSEGSLRYDLTNAIAIPGLLRAAGSIIAEATERNAVIITSGDTKLYVSESGITARGNLTVEGNISFTGSLNGNY